MQDYHAIPLPTQDQILPKICLKNAKDVLSWTISACLQRSERGIAFTIKHLCIEGDKSVEPQQVFHNKHINKTPLI